MKKSNAPAILIYQLSDKTAINLHLKKPCTIKIAIDKLPIFNNIFLIHFVLFIATINFDIVTYKRMVIDRKVSGKNAFEKFPKRKTINAVIKTIK